MEIVWLMFPPSLVLLQARPTRCHHCGHSAYFWAWNIVGVPYFVWGKESKTEWMNENGKKQMDDEIYGPRASDLDTVGLFFTF